MLAPAQIHTPTNSSTFRIVERKSPIVFNQSSPFQTTAPFLKELLQVEQILLSQKFIQNISQRTEEQCDPLTQVFQMVIYKGDPEKLQKACFKAAGYVSRLFSTENWKEWSAMEHFKLRSKHAHFLIS